MIDSNDLEVAEPMVRSLPRNACGRDLLIGDIHGAFSQVEAELERVGFDERCDRLVATGDLVDRGPESWRAFEFLGRRWFHSVRGNHEQSLLAHVLGGAPAWICEDHTWLHEFDPDTQHYFARRLARLPWAIELETSAGTVVILHAQVPLHYPRWRDARARLVSPDGGRERVSAVSGRSVFLRAAEGLTSATAAHPNARLQDIAWLIHGHSVPASFDLMHWGNRIWLDTGGWLPVCAGRSPGEWRGSGPRFTLVDAENPLEPL